MRGSGSSRASPRPNRSKVGVTASAADKSTNSGPASTQRRWTRDVIAGAAGPEVRHLPADPPGHPSKPLDCIRSIHRA